MDYFDIEDTEQLSVEQQVALAMGDDDATEWDEPSWRVNGRRAKSFEKDRLDFDAAPSQPNEVLSH